MTYLLLSIHDFLWLALHFLLGTIIGSFLNVCIVRIPQKAFFSSWRSLCPSCRDLIAWYDNIPIVSFLTLKGRCRRCRTRISFRYPVIELATGLMFLLVYWKFPYLRQIEVGMFAVHDFTRFYHAAIFSAVMLAASAIDLEHMIIPDIFSLGLVATSPLVIWLHPELSLQSSVLGILFGAGIIYLVAWLYYFLRRDVGIGMGDMKLLAGIGGWLGVESILPTILIGSLVGSAVGISLIVTKKSFHTKSAIPFGPFLAGAAWIFLMLGPQMKEWMHLYWP